MINMRKINYFKKSKFIFYSIFYFIHINFSRYINHFYPNPLLVNIEITKRCNLSCIHCDIRKTPETYTDIVNKEFSTTEIKKLIDSLKSFGIKYISISGGEPFLRKDIFEIIDYVKNKDMGLHISSNGILITEEVAKKINELKLDAISISLDATIPELHDEIRGVQGAFDMAVEAIRNLTDCKDKYTQVGVSPIITDLNLNNLPELVDFANELGVDAIRFQPWHISLGNDETEKILNINGNRLEYLDNIIEQIIESTKKQGIYTNSDTYLKGVRKFFQDKNGINVECFAGSFTCNINWVGGVFPCAFLPEIGNVRIEPFKKVWKSKKFNDVRRNITNGNCQKCWMGCFIEPSLRCSLKYAICNPTNYLKDLWFYYKIN